MTHLSLAWRPGPRYSAGMRGPADKPSFATFRKALATLEVAFAKPPANDLERDCAIQRFEYTFELAWKSARKQLIWFGRADVSGSPKPILRAAHEEGLLEDIEAWLGFVEARTVTSHAYDQGLAQEVYDAAERFLPQARELLARLERA